MRRIMNKGFDLFVAIICFGILIGSVSAVPCFDNAWIEVPFAEAFRSSVVSNMSNVSDCQSMCIAYDTCTGVVLENVTDSDNTCYLNYDPINSTNSSINFNASASSTYFSLLRNYPSCNYQEYNCSFVWVGQRDLHGFYGVDANRDNLNDCIQLCQETSACQAVDWNHQDNTCWIHSSDSVITGALANITFFVKNCVSPLASTTKATTPGPPTKSTTTTTTTTTPTTTTTTTPTTTTSTTTPTTSTTTTPTTTTTTTPTATTTSTTTTTTTPTTTTTSTSSTTTTTTPTTTTTTIPTTTTTTMPATTTTTMPTTTTTTMPTTTTTTTTMITPMSTTTTEPGYAEMSEYAYYPMAIKPAYIVLAGLGGGCILLVLTAIIILCEYPLHKGSKYSTTSTVTTVRTHQTVTDNSYGESHEPERLDMDEMAEGDVKTYYNAEEVH